MDKINGYGWYIQFKGEALENFRKFLDRKIEEYGSKRRLAQHFGFRGSRTVNDWYNLGSLALDVFEKLAGNIGKVKSMTNDPNEITIKRRGGKEVPFSTIYKE